METRRPLIVDVARGRLEDGPGIRSVVFFKGCPLRCIFCHNPEAQAAGPEIAFTAERCLNCGACAAACPRSAIDLRSPGRIDRALCDLCGDCARACPSGALRLIGVYWPVDSLAGLLLRDLPFYRRSGGGVTLSGGECTLFPEYVQALLELLSARGVHVAIETSGCFDYEVFARRILPYVQLVLFDVKLVEESASLHYLGMSGRRMLDNLRRLLAERAVEVQPRIPLIPGVTDGTGNLAAIVAMLRDLGAATVSLLPYNPLGLAMYPRLGRPVPDLPAGFTPERERRAVETVRQLLGS